MSKKVKSDAGASILDAPITDIDRRPGELETFLKAKDIEGAVAYATEALGPEDRAWASKMFAGWLPDEGAELAAEIFAEPEPKPKRPKLSVAAILAAAKAGLPKVEPEEFVDEVDQLAAAQEREAELEERLRAAEQAKPAAEPIRATLPKAKQLGQPDGTVGEIAEYVVRSSMYPVASAGHIVGTGVVGTLIGRRVAGPSGPRGCGTHHYEALVGGSGIGKEQVEGATKSLFTAAKAAALIGTGRFKSDAGIITHLIRKPVSLCVMDELGAYFARLAKPRQFEMESTAIFRNVWGKSWSRYDTPQGAGGESVAILSPHLTLVGMSTIEELGRACQGRDIANGFLNRWILRVELSDPVYQRVSEADLAISKDLRDNLRKLYPPMLEQVLDRPMVEGAPQKRLKWGPGAEDIFEGLIAMNAAETDLRKKVLFRRGPEKTVRVATCIAAGRFDEFVSRADMEWAMAYVISGDEALLLLLHEYGEEEKYSFDQLCKEIIRRVRAAGGTMSKRDLGRSFQGNVNWRKQLDDALKHLCQTGQLVRGTVTPEGGIGRPSVSYSLPEVAKEFGWNGIVEED